MKDKGFPVLLFFLASISNFAQSQMPSNTASAQDSSTEDLQKATQNPVASLISVPLQNNFNFDIEPDDRVQNVLNIRTFSRSSLLASVRTGIL
jgi:hypothetical protein